MHIFDDEPSEIDIFRRKQKEMSLAEIIHYFNSQIDDELYNSKNLDYDSIKLFRELISRKKSVETIELDKNSDSSSDTQSDSGDDFDKIFNSFSNKNKSKKSKNSKKVKNTKFEQKFEILKDGTRKWVKTPGEEGSYLIEEKLTQTADIKHELSDNWWRKVSRKVTVLASSPQDPLFVVTNDLFKLALDKIKNAKDVAHGSYKTRYKPY